MTSTQVKQGWQRVKIGDICNFQYGKSLPQRVRVAGKYPVYGSGGIVDNHNEFFVEAPCIIVGRKGSIGTVYLSKKNCSPIDTVFYIEQNKSVYDILFLYYLLLNYDFSRLGGDAAVPGLNRNVAYLQEVNVPPIPTQQKIASILSSFDDLIENNTKRIKILENTAQLIYKEWFVDFKFPNHEKVKMIDSGSEIGDIPEGWEVKEIKDFGEVVTGKTPSKKVPENFGNDIPFIKTPDMHGEMFIIETNESLSLEGAETQKKKTLPENSLIVSCIGSVGVVAITSKDSQTNQQINAVVPNDEVLREYLYIVFLGLKPTLEGLGSSGATMCNVNKQKFETIKILSPSKQVLEDYHRIVAPMFDETLALQQRKKQLQETRDLLLPKLVNGEVVVDNLTIK